jgi:hypothetical protein
MHTFHFLSHLITNPATLQRAFRSVQGNLVLRLPVLSLLGPTQARLSNCVPQRGVTRRLRRSSKNPITENALWALLGFLGNLPSKNKPPTPQRK